MAVTRKKAIKLAVDALERRRRMFATGHNAYLAGYDSVWTEREHKKYVELCDAIEIIEKGIRDG